MVFNGSANVEQFYFHPVGKHNEVHCIEMIINIDSPTFTVTCCCIDDWKWDFWYSKTSYEQIRFNIMDAIFESENMEELLNSLNKIFYDGFSDILVDEECDGCCEICERKGSNGFFADGTNNGYLN